MSAYNFVRCLPNFPNFFCSTPKRSFLSTPFRFCHYLHRFQRYLRSNSKVDVNRTDFCAFFALPNFKGGAVPPKFVLALTPHLEARQVPKFRRVTPPNSEVIMAHLFHFKPIFDPPFEKSCKGGPRPRWGVRPTHLGDLARKEKKHLQ